MREQRRKTLRPVRVLYYFQHTLQGADHIFASVQYFRRSPDAWESFRRLDIPVYRLDIEDLLGECIVLVHRLHAGVGSYPMVDNSAALVMLPQKAKVSFI